MEEPETNACPANAGSCSLYPPREHARLRVHQYGRRNPEPQTDEVYIRAPLRVLDPGKLGPAVWAFGV